MCRPTTFVFGALALLTSFIATPVLAQPTVLLMHSQPGDYIGAGGNWVHTPADGSFSATRNADNGVSLQFLAFPNVWWYLDFAAPQSAALAPGAYEAATRYPFQASTEPGLSISGTGRGCNTLTGRFTVFEVVYGAGDTITSFAANFEQHCEGMAAALFGSIRFNAAPGAGYTVSVSTMGSGSGTVSSFPAGLSCGSTCATSGTDGLITALIATPAPGSAFSSWGGAADCADGVVSEAASVACTATFVACSYTLAPDSATGSAFGGFGQFTVQATPGCSWTPASDASWLSVDTTTRTGTQPLNYTYVPRGPYSTSRVATITVGTATFTLTQPGLTPQVLVNPTTATMAAGGGTVVVSVVSNVVDVAWSASSNDAWLSVPAAGMGSAAVGVIVAPNPSTSTRSGSVVIAGTVVTVEQFGSGPPGPPVDFTAAVTSGTALFTWSPSGTNADVYRLEAGLAPGATQLLLQMPATAGAFQVPGVPPGRYYVRARGVNINGAGPATDDLELVVGANGQSLPAAPRSLAAIVTNGVLQAQWQPSGFAGEVVTGFVLEAGTSGGRTDVIVPLGMSQSIAVANVPPGAYFLRVRATNGTGTGAPSPERMVVSGGAPAPPGPPLDVTSIVSGSLVTIRWNPPAAGATPDRYRLEVGAIRGATALTYDWNLPTTSVGFGMVPPGTYFVRVRGGNAQGFGLASADVRIDVR